MLRILFFFLSAPIIAVYIYNTTNYKESYYKENLHSLRNLLTHSCVWTLVYYLFIRFSHILRKNISSDIYMHCNFMNSLDSTISSGSYKII